MSVKLDVAKRFAEIFAGRTDAFGVLAGGVVHEPLTQRKYSDHLNGITASSIGVFPLRDDNTVRWCAVDLDEPNFELAYDIAQFIPADCWIERSRSGNAHVWVFFKDDCPAYAARGQLRKALELVGKPRVEIFPKQAALREGMVGNYINLPYYGNERPMVWQKGSEPLGDLAFANAPGYSVEGFIADVDATLVDPRHWVNLCKLDGIEPPSLDFGASEGFGERKSLHECAMHMLRHKDDNPLTQGHRHVVLFNLAKMFLNCQDYDTDEAMELVSAFNEAGTDPLPYGEIKSLVLNAARGGWTSTGCDDPIMAPYVSPDCPIAHG